MKDALHPGRCSDCAYLRINSEVPDDMLTPFEDEGAESLSHDDIKAALADNRIPALLDTPAAIRFLSVEPMLGPVDLATGLRTWADGRPVQINRHLHWVICGGESGPNARPMHPDWARALRDQCTTAGVPFFFKQWGEWAPRTALLVEKIRNGQTVQYSPGVFGQRVGKKAAGRELDGRTWDEYPGGEH